MKKLFYIFLIIISAACTRNNYSVLSPDGRIKVTLFNKDGQISYNLSLNGKIIVDESPLGIVLKSAGQDFTSNLSISDTSTHLVTEEYQSKVGKRKNRLYKGNELILTVANQESNKMNVIFRASNDGVAFRYKLNNTESDTVEDEISYFKLPQKSEAWIQYNEVSFGNYELYYSHRLLDTMSQHEYLMPALMMTPDSQWILIHDAAVFGDYASCRLFNEGQGKLKIQVPKARGRWEQIAANKNLITPWRVIMIGDGLASIVESTLIDDLSSASVIADQSWIKPGVVAFPWWAVSDANDRPEVLKKYIDMAAEMGWEYLEFDLACMNWYKENKPDPNYWRTVKFIPDIIKYAASKGIECYGWDMRSTMEKPGVMEEIISTNKKLGLKGIKVDFVNDDNQFGMRFREAVLKEAAKQHMMISFHGDMAPRGICRTYPNLMTEEGVRGCEYYKDEIGGTGPTATPEHNCILPFTRNVVGSMDYTPTAFSTPKRKSTYAHELAFSVICESGWLCMCDSPEAYLNSPAKEFLQKLEAAWDDTKFIDGLPGKFCCMARRHGNDWFVVGINAGKQRTVSLLINFLKEGSYKVKLYSDGEEPQNNIRIQDVSISKDKPVEIAMAENGGFAFFIQNAY